MPKSFLIKKTDKTWRRYSPKELPAGPTFSTVGPTFSSGGPTFSTAGPTFSTAGPTLSPDCSVHVEEDLGRRMRFVERTVVEEVVSCRKTIWSPPTEIEPCIGPAWSGGPIVRDTSTVLRQFTDLIQPMAFRLKENGFLFDSAHPHKSRVPPSPFIFSERFSLQLPPYRRYHGSPPREMDLLTPPSPNLDHLSRLHDSRSLDLSLDHCKNIPSPLSPACSASAMLDFSPTGAHSEAGSGNSISGSQHSSSRRCSSFQDGVTVGYTYDAFFVSDGRSRRRNPLTIMPDQSRTRYKCSECGKHYATSSNLSRHKQTHRSLDSQQAKQCPHCHKIYVSMPALSMHILTHDLKYQCNVCDKAFSRPWLLQGHLRSHTGEKPFGCAHCGKAFADRSNLRAHMQTHSAFKLYTCKRCNKSFALKAYLNKHLESACFKDDDDDECSNSSMTSIWSV